MKSSLLVIIILIVLMCFGCQEEATNPKPRAMLGLTFPEATYNSLQTSCPYTFEHNNITVATAIDQKNPCWLNISYPQLKATIYLSYYPVTNNLRSLLRDAQNITKEHMVKADAIKPEVYTNPDKRVFAEINKVSGDAASTTQFYATDSTSHFISGSVYFRAKPNYDSILPAAHYLYKDVVHLIETLEWEE
ncbi:gliding motility lipoprotein GldD [Aquimarina sp. ERC-38]|uniref:gliding motility lipoprotein GldD n=1 Tax=Aquimarina sp. ERC-38 TaxID=2949996 RepID=UPI002247A185|nr:gliding motility lipoprotein GldD [Aquimarina sp. ERC-38]UZO81686.1 gliding motility lipoprotein GldD [Aquimarina sp. ERC-38]